MILLDLWKDYEEGMFGIKKVVEIKDQICCTYIELVPHCIRILHKNIADDIQKQVKFTGSKGLRILGRYRKMYITKRKCELLRLNIVD